MQFNNVIIAAAGSGKTTLIINHALKQKDKKILILTYTLFNLEQIKQKIINKVGVIPKNLHVQSWFSFLLKHCVRPYQNFIYEKKRIENIQFENGKSVPFVKMSDIEKYYFKNKTKIYTDKISLFACKCNESSRNLVINRLEKIYDYIYIDEIQDLAGYDFDLLRLMFNSNIKINVVGDNRQATFSTNNSPKNKKYKGKNILDLFTDWQDDNLCKIKYKSKSHRCNQAICDFADILFPNMPKTKSYNVETTGHDGIFFITQTDLRDYICKYNPILLRYDKRTKIDDTLIYNFGAVKGLTFERVLIIPNEPIKKYLQTGDITKVENSKAKLYVAITRAKSSVAFLVDETLKK